MSSKFARELKKLECLVNYDGTCSESGFGKEGWAITLGYK